MGGRWFEAGARFVSEKKTRPLPWTREIPFKLSLERDLRPGKRPKPRHLRVVSGPKRAKVAGSHRGKAVRAPRRVERVTLFQPATGRMGASGEAFSVRARGYTGRFSALTSLGW